MAAGLSDEAISHEHTKAMAPLGAGKARTDTAPPSRGLIAPILPQGLVLFRAVSRPVREGTRGLGHECRSYLPIAEVSVNAFLLLGLGGVVGVLSGMFGVGGGFLMTPLLFFNRHSARGRGGHPRPTRSSPRPSSGALAHLRRKTVDLRMGTVLLVGGLIGAALGIQLFNYLKALGQVDLLVRLSYVVFLGIIGGLMFIESLRANPQVTLRGRHAHAPASNGLAHALPFKMRSAPRGSTSR